MQSSMLMIWLGALLVIAGVLFMAAQPMWRGRLSKAAAPADVAASSRCGRPEGFGFKAELALLRHGGARRHPAARRLRPAAPQRESC